MTTSSAPVATSYGLAAPAADGRSVGAGDSTGGRVAAAVLGGRVVATGGEGQRAGGGGRCGAAGVTHGRSDGRRARRRFPGLPPTLAPVQSVTGVVQHYAWGDPEFIPRLLGVAADGRPWAELWLGTHPNGPATLADGRPLRDVTGDLPYLLKVLAARRAAVAAGPPDPRAGGGRVRRRALPRPGAEARAALRPDPVHGLLRGAARRRHAAPCSTSSAPTSWRRSSATTARGPRWRRCTAGDSTSSRRARAPRRSDRPEARWVRSWPARYPGDPSVAVTLLLNLVELQPGEAIQLGPGNLHAYLVGCRHRADGRQRQRRARRADRQARRHRRPPRRRRPHAARPTR